MDENYVSDSSNDATTWSLNLTDLPQQVIECLKLTGFNVRSSLTMLEDIAEIEAFLRENARLMLEVYPESASIAYGVFKGCPDKFKLLPGHKVTIQNFVKKLREEEGMEPCTSSTSGSKFRGQSQRRCRGRPPSKILPSSTQRKANTYSYIANCSDADAEDIDLACEKVNSNLKAWIARQEGRLGELQEGSDYSFFITATQKEIQCLACRKACSIFRNKDCYVISNYTEHVKENCPAINNSSFQQSKSLTDIGVYTIEEITEHSNTVVETVGEVEMCYSSQENMNEGVYVVLNSGAVLDASNS